jgi:hypothetical protein
MWWKAEEGIKTDADFLKFRNKVMNTPVVINEANGQMDISVMTTAGKLGVKADLLNKKRLEYYNPIPLPKEFLFNVDGLEIGRSIMEKYK